MLRRTHRRSGTTSLECAFVFPVFLLLVFGLVIGGLGVFRYQELAALAREAARYASVHGAKYAEATSQPAATPQDIFDNIIRPRAAALDLSRLTCEVTWDPDNMQGSTVTVTLTYRWLPELFLGGRDLSSTAAMPISF